MRNYEGNVIPAALMGTIICGEKITPRMPWNTRKIEKGKRRSETPGKTKGPTCQTDPMKKFFFCHPHAYMHPQYGEWCQIARNMNGGKKNSAGS
jgi:hypothetical protein